jgi:SNF family Na+-dependent transporter
MIAVAGGIVLALVITCMLIGFAVMILSIFRAIGRRGMAYNISIVRRVPPADGKRWLGVAMMVVVVIGLGYVVNKTTQPNVACAHVSGATSCSVSAQATSP